MSHDLVREKIALDQKIGRQTTQVLLEGDLIVPDVKPDMSVILQTDAKVTIDRIEPTTDRVSFMGKFDVQVLYLARGSEKPVHSMHIQAPVDDFINMDGVTKDAWVEACAAIANVDYRMVNDRKVNYRAVVDVTLTCEMSVEHDIVTNLSDVPENQLLKNTIALTRRVENKMERFTVREALAIPAGKPNIREILQTGAAITNKEVRVLNGRVTVGGELNLTTLYRGDHDGSLIEFAEHETPFSGAFDVPGAKDDMMADVTLTVLDKSFVPQPDADGEERVLDAEITLNAVVKVYGQEMLDVLEDAYCINKCLDVKKAPVNFPKMICRNKNQSPVKDTVVISDNCPDILQIFRVTGRAQADDVKIIEDKVVVEGVIEADVLYVAENDETPLFSYHTALPFRQVIETKGARDDMQCDMEVNVDHVGFNMLSGREMELRFLLSFNTQVFEEVEANVITDIEFYDMEREILDQMPSMTAYIVQKGDTLWKIAKRYNTSVDEILMVNDIENPNKIYPNQKLLILKKSM